MPEKICWRSGGLAQGLAAAGVVDGFPLHLFYQSGQRDGDVYKRQVYERFNQHKKGKGYALDYLFRTLAHEGRNQYDGYLIFDADNLVDPNFVSEMNKVFDSGNYGAITCYRNSRNFGALSLIHI